MEHLLGEISERSELLCIAFLRELRLERFDAHHERVIVNLGPSLVDAADPRREQKDEDDPQPPHASLRHLGRTHG